jgi:hypothetical protein
MTYRQIDYLVRLGIITPAYAPARGSGSRASWSRSQLPVLRMVAFLREHGARDSTLRTAVVEAERLNENAWGARIVVTIDGRIMPLFAADANGWVMDFAQLAHPITSEAADEELALIAS